jgi:opacity protein-like surface antigen
MQTKLALLTSTAIAVLALASPAQAAGPFYVSVLGGANFLQDDSFRAITGPTVSANTLNFHPNSETGFLIGAAVGMHVDQIIPGLRVEAEVDYRSNHSKGTWQSNTGDPTDVSSGALDFDHTTWSVLANAWYDFSLGSSLKPYVGGGIGWGETKLDGKFVSGAKPNFSFTDDGFAWQVGAGVNYAISPNVLVGVGYRYFSGPDVTVSAPGAIAFGNPSTGKINSDSQSVLLSLTFNM